MNRTWRILVGYLIYIVFGTIVFMLPVSQVSGEGLPFIDALFVAVSGISTTGLSPIPLVDMTFLGQFVLMTLIFLGGIGYMTFSAFISLSIRGSISTDQHQVLRQSFALPKDINLRQFVANIGIYALIVQIIGAILLFFIFQDDPRANPIWSAVFHSVSTFATAGFSLYPDNFESYVNHGALNLVINLIAILGALGFIVATDVMSVLRGQRKSITLTTRVILWIMFGFLATSTLLMMFFGGISQGEGLYQDFLISSFQNINAMTTAGYNTVPIADISGSFIFMLIILMVVGGAPSGTAGGMKITTISAVFAAVRAFIFGDTQIKLLQRAIPMERVRIAIATAMVYLTMLAGGYLLLLIVEPNLGFQELLFEATSALGTVGLSMNLTAELDYVGKLVIILMMYMGRVGVLTIMTTVLVQHRKKVQAQYEDVAI
ncbi:MAG: TrkH family potassium uptake protein [Culicoidibacterales bacterium]